MNSWSARDIDDLLTPFEEGVVGINDRDGNPQLFKGVVSLNYKALNNPDFQGAPATASYLRMEMRSADLPKVQLEQNLTLSDRNNEVVVVRSVQDEGQGIAVVYCGRKRNRSNP